MSAPTSRGNSLQNIQNYATTSNPVFKVKVMSLATNYEQPAGGKERKGGQDDPTIKFKMGEKVTGTEKGADKVYTGKITKIIKNKSIIVIIDDENEKEINLDASSCKSLKKEVEKDDYELSFTTENYIMGLEEFLMEKQKVTDLRLLFLLDNPKYTKEPFVTTKKAFQRYCKENNLPFDLSILKPVNTGDPKWFKIPVDKNIIISH